ncbi:MAG: hypothetical protein GY754_44195 [bacterium]|nr:hypothetical protein [bacterium]
MFKKSLLVFLGMLVISSTALFAQDEPGEPVPADGSVVKEEKGAADKLSDLGLSGKMYIQYGAELSTSDDSNKNSSFSIQRMYLQYKRDIGGPFSIKITTDVGQLDSTSGATTVTSEPYELYVKNAYVQLKQKMGVVTLKSQLGMIGTPNIGKTDKMMDLRWVYNNYSIDKSKSIIGTSIDTSADLGFNLSLNIMKLVEVTADITQGEGYKEAAEVNDNKVIHAMVSITPIKGLYINGFSKFGKVQSSDVKSNYYGGGAAWKSDLIKVGANFLMAAVDTAAYTSTEAWIHANLDPAIEIPILIVGRFAYGKNNDVDDTGNTIIGGGLGYQFNKHFRALAYFETNSSNASGSKADSAIYAKTEAKF